MAYTRGRTSISTSPLIPQHVGESPEPDPHRLGGVVGTSPIVAHRLVDDIGQSRTTPVSQLVGQGENMGPTTHVAGAPETPSPAGRRFGWLRWALVVASIGLLARMAINHFPEIRDGFGQLLTRSWWLVAVALLLEVVWTFSLANVYRSSLRGFGGRLGRTRAIGVSMGAFSLSRILPGGGAAGSIFAAREIVRLGNPVPITVASMLVSWWVSMLALALIVGLGTAAGAVGGEIAPAHLVGPLLVAGALTVVAGIAVIAVRQPRMRSRIASGLARSGARLRVSAAAHDWETLATSGLPVRRLLPLVGWAALSWAADAAALWMVFAGFGVRLHPGVLLVGYGLANLINALPELTPGWLGVLETALAAAYAGLEVPAGIAVVAVLSYRMVSYWLPVAAGMGPALGMLRGRPGAEDPVSGPRRLEAAA